MLGSAMSFHEAKLNVTSVNIIAQRVKGQPLFFGERIMATKRCSEERMKKREYIDLGKYL